MGKTEILPEPQPIQPPIDAYVISKDIAIFIFFMVLGLILLAFVLGYVKADQGF